MWSTPPRERLQRHQLPGLRDRPDFTRPLSTTSSPLRSERRSGRIVAAAFTRNSISFEEGCIVGLPPYVNRSLREGPAATRNVYSTLRRRLRGPDQPPRTPGDIDPLEHLDRNPSQRIPAGSTSLPLSTALEPNDTTGRSFSTDFFFLRDGLPGRQPRRHPGRQRHAQHVALRPS